MPDISHVSENNLIRFADGEMNGKPALAVEIHLQECPECRSRLAELKNAADAYTEYHSRVLKPSLESSRAWPRLQFAHAPADERKIRSRFSPWWVFVPAFLCGLAVLAILFYNDAPQRRVTQLLARAAEAPIPSHRRLQVTRNGRSWFRPAVLESDTAQNAAFEPTRALFVRANYNWNNPLSARSSAAWRNRLRHKHDEVVSLNSDDGRDRFYRVRTDTSDGVLRVASLTLRADTLYPVEGKFHFENQEDVSMAEAREMSAPQGLAAPPKSTAPHTAPVESKVTPQDESRVFAALNAIGADAGEPLDVNVDPAQQHVFISGIGVPPDRQRDIRQALASVPNAITRFESGAQSPANTSSLPLDTYANNSAPLRHELEAKAGSVQAFQYLADRALENSSSLVAQAHALAVLAQKFPPALESAFNPADQATLTSLRRGHATIIEQAVAQLRNGLLPVLNSSTQAANGETRTAAQTSWQAGADRLLAESKLLDVSLGRLLAGSYSQQTGAEILTHLPEQLQNVENLAHAEAAQ